MQDSNATLPRLVERWATDDPERTFLVQAETEDRLTYSAAHRDGLQWAHALQRAGVGPGETVLTMLPTRFEAVRCWLGITWLVASEVPINTSYRGDMLAYAFDNSSARIAVISVEYLDRVVALGDRLAAVETIVVPDATASTVLPELPCRVVGPEFLDDVAVPESSATSAMSADFAGPQPWDVAAIFYTSGTTGASKGVLYSHAQSEATALGCNLTNRADDVTYIPFPMYHVTGKVMVYGVALFGATGLLRESFKTDLFWEDVRRFGCTCTVLLGAMANFLFRQPATEFDGNNPMERLQMVPTIPETAEFEERFGVVVDTCFNMTEISVPIWAIGATQLGAPAGSCGRIREGYECRVVDEHDMEVGPGQLGELIVRADRPWVLNGGYFNMPDKTAEAWRNGWFHTGDAFTVDADGWFFFADRFKDALRRRGENISSMEVESLVNAHPAVLESAVVAVPSEWGEEEMLAAVVAMPGATVDPGELHAFLIETSPRFMVPDFIRVLAELPKTPTEKVRKVTLREAGITPDTWRAPSTRRPPR